MSFTINNKSSQTKLKHSILEIANQANSKQQKKLPLTCNARAEHVNEGAPVLLREKAVEDKVAGRIDGHEKVEDVGEARYEGHLVGVALGLAKDRIDENAGGRRLAEDEENDHGDEHDGDANLLARGGRR